MGDCCLPFQWITFFCWKTSWKSIFKYALFIDYWHYFLYTCSFHHSKVSSFHRMTTNLLELTSIIRKIKDVVVVIFYLDRFVYQQLHWGHAFCLFFWIRVYHWPSGLHFWPKLDRRSFIKDSSLYLSLYLIILSTTSIEK